MLRLPVFLLSLPAAAALTSALPAIPPCEVAAFNDPSGFVRLPALRDDVLAVPRLVVQWPEPEHSTVTIHRRIGGEWIVEAVLDSMNDETPADVFGAALALDVDVLVVGDHGFPVDQPISGAAMVYRYDGRQWALEAVLTAPETNPFPNPSSVGRSVAYDDEVVIAGASGHHANGIFQSGAAFVFRNGADGWKLETMLTHPNASESDRFGFATDLSNGVALIGAHGIDGPAQNTGRAFIYRFDGEEWALEATLMPPDAGGMQWFGWSVALDAAGEIAVVGALQDTSQNGAVYVFRHDGESWTFEQKLTAAEPIGTAPQLGTRVAIDAPGNVIVAAAPGDGGAGWEAGAFHVFRHDGAQWIEEAKVTPGSGFATLFSSNSIWEDEAAARMGGSQSQAFLYAGLQGRDCLGTGQPDACDIFDGLAEDSTGSGIPAECEFAGDLNGDGAVDVDDLLILLSLWGDCEADPNNDPDSPAGCFGDISHDGQIGIDDLLLLLANWG